MNKNRKRRGRSEGSIFERKDGTWVASVSCGYSATGKRRRRTIYGKSKEEVKQKLIQLQRDAAAGLNITATKTSVSDFVDQWIREAEKNHAASTIDRYKLTASHIKEYLARLPISSLRTAHVQQLFLDMQKAKESKDAQLKVGRLLSVACKNAVRLGLLPSNPVSDVPKPQRREIVTLDIDQLRKLLEVSRNHRVFRAYVPLAIDAGCRLRELLGLEWRDVDFQANTVTIVRTLSEIRGKILVKPPKTHAGKRRIKLAASTVNALRDHKLALRREGIDSPFVFPSETGTYLLGSNVLKSFHALLAKSDLPKVSLHSLRHSSATVLITSGASPKIVQERLGHTKVDTTLSIYTHVFQSAQDAAAEVFEKHLYSKSTDSSKALETESA